MELLSREVTPVYFSNRKTATNTPCGHNSQFVTLKKTIDKISTAFLKVKIK